MVRGELEDKRTSLLGLLALFGAEGESWEVHGYVWVWVCGMRVRQSGYGTCAKEREEKVRARRGVFLYLFFRQGLTSGLTGFRQV